MRFVLIRHGQSTNNALAASAGDMTERHPDSELTPHGREEVRLLAAAVQAGVLPWRVDHLYCSLMVRAIQTAAPLADALDMPLTAHPELFEVWGPYQRDDRTGERVSFPGSGRTALQSLCLRLVLPEQSRADGWWTGPVETDLTVASARARRLVTELREMHDPDATIALVSHGHFIQFLVLALLRIDAMSGWFEIRNTSMSLLCDDSGHGWPGVKLTRLNWAPHLGTDGMDEGNRAAQQLG